MKGRFTYLKKEEVQQIHEQTMEILSDEGISVMEEFWAEWLLNSGAKKKKDKFILPADLLMERLHACSEHTEGLNSLSQSVSYANVFDFAFLEKENKFYPFGLKELKQLIHCILSLKQLHSLFLPWMPVTSIRHQYYSLALKYCAKPILFPVRAEADVKYLSSDPAKGRGINVVLSGEALSFGKVKGIILKGLSQNPMPIAVSSQLPLSVATAPLEYLILLGNLENLIGLFLVKTAQTRTPLYYSGFRKPSTLPLGLIRTEDFRYAFLHAAQSQMAHYYHLPFFSWTEDLVYFEQGTESFKEKQILYYSCLAMIKGGIQVWMGRGSRLDSLSLDRLEQDNEISANLTSYQKQYSLSTMEQTLSLIRKVGIQGDYIFY